MKNIFVIVSLFTITLFITGCPKKGTVVEESKAPSTAETTVQPKPATETPIKTELTTQKKPTEEIRTRELSTAEKLAQLKEEFKSFQYIYFDYDRYDLKSEEREKLGEVSKWMTRNSDVRLRIEGHCDERGTNDYNLALGDRRAETIRHYLSDLGVDIKRLSAVSYGEEKPVCSEAGEDCWHRNRRGQLLIQE